MFKLIGARKRGGVRREVILKNSFAKRLLIPLFSLLILTLYNGVSATTVQAAPIVAAVTMDGGKSQTAPLQGQYHRVGYEACKHRTRNNLQACLKGCPRNQLAECSQRCFRADPCQHLRPRPTGRPSPGAR